MPPSDTEPNHHVAGATSRRLRGTSLPLAPGRRIGRFVESLGGRTLIASLAVAAAILATAVPAFALIATSDDGSSRLDTSSDSGAPAAARISDLGVATFIGDIPFLAQQRFLTAAAGGEAEGRRFVDGARQAAVASYVQDVGLQMTLPYLSDATEEKQEIEAWTEAVEQRQASTDYGFQPAWPPGGTSLGSTVTFYTCAGGGFCGSMAAGPVVHNGAAACSYDLPFGTQFYLANDPAQRIFTCLDRGLLTPTWVDIWFHTPDEGWAFQSLVGTYSTIVIVS